MLADPLRNAAYLPWLEQDTESKTVSKWDDGFAGECFHNICLCYLNIHKCTTLIHWEFLLTCSVCLHCWCCWWRCVVVLCHKPCCDWWFRCHRYWFLVDCVAIDFRSYVIFGVVIGHPFVAISFVTEVVVARGVAINIRSLLSISSVTLSSL